jgi:hypothetical protein
MSYTIKKSKTKKCPFTKGNSNFTKKHYNSGDGMLTYIWGPPMWHFLHTMSFNYPIEPTEEQKTNYYNFVLSLKNILPCGKCRTNLSKNLKTHPLKKSHLKDRESFSRYIYHLHEVINKMLKKKSGLSYEEVRNTYENFRARCSIDQIGEDGCIEPMYGKKAKCLLKIVPLDTKCKTMEIDDKCMRQSIK